MKKIHVVCTLINTMIIHTIKEKLDYLQPHTDDMDLSAVKPSVSLALSKIRSLDESPGPCMREFFENLVFEATVSSTEALLLLLAMMNRIRSFPYNLHTLLALPMHYQTATLMSRLTRWTFSASLNRSLTAAQT